MNRSAIRQPRNKHPWVSKEKGRGCKHIQNSDDSASEDEQESSDRYTEDSEETEYSEAKLTKKDQVTQKNLSSPLPSFLKTPIYRDFSAKNKLPPVSPKEREKRKTSNLTPRYSKRQTESFAPEDPTICLHHRHQEFFDEKVREKHAHHFPRSKLRYEYRGPEEMSGNPSEETGDYSKNSTETTTSGSGRPVGSSWESEMQESPSKCPECTKNRWHEESKRQNEVTGPFDSEKELKVHNSFVPDINLEQGSNRKFEKGGKVREKLVYVVEEEGKDTTKVETDLFSVNEILTIKKDLVELSEFAKKLKKLKELKRDPEKGNNVSEPCHCKPVTQLLQDVNKRIEALEARQEELERGSNKSEGKGVVDPDSNKSEFRKPITDTPPIMPKQSAMTSVPSFPKVDMSVSRAEGLSKNSEIVNELMDIKTKLQKLEKRRMSKEITAEAMPAGDIKPTNKKGHAIAVFSSRTYILTSDNKAKGKSEGLETKSIGKKAKDLIDLSKFDLDNVSQKEEKNRVHDTEKTKETVANWLKSVSPTQEVSEKSSNVYVAPERVKEKNSGENKKEDNQLKCRRCAKILNEEDFQNQEPQKNRATEEEAERDESGDLVEKRFSLPYQEVPSIFECKRCYMTASGRIFAMEIKSPSKILKTLEGDKSTKIGVSPEKVVKVNTKLKRRTVSSYSIPSVILAMEQLKKVKNQTLKDRVHEKPDLPKMSTSKSVHEMRSVSSVSKKDKTVFNNKKKYEKMLFTEDKRFKENKNQNVKKEIEEKCKINMVGGDSPTTSGSRSELLRAFSLETDSNNPSHDFKNAVINNIQVYSMTTVSNELKYSDSLVKNIGGGEFTKKKEKEEREKKIKAELKKCGMILNKSCPLHGKKLPKYSSSFFQKWRKAMDKDFKLHKRDTRNEASVQMIYTALKDGSGCRNYHFKSNLLFPHNICETCGNKRKACKCKKEKKPLCRHKTAAQEFQKQTDEFKALRQHFDEESDYKCNKLHAEEDSSCGRSVRYYDTESDSRPCSKPSSSKQNIKEGPCIFANFFRNLRSLYPKFSNLQLLPKQCEKDPKKHPFQGKESSNYECAGKETSESFDKSGKQFASSPCNCSRCQEKQKNENFKSIKVYAQSQNEQVWPGFRPFNNVIEESDSEDSSSSSASSNFSCSANANNDDFFTNQKQVFCATEEQLCNRQCKMTRKTCKADCKSRYHKIKKLGKNKCMCDKCGNVHRKKKPKDKKCVYEKPDPCCPPPRGGRPFSNVEKKPSPFLSYLRGFCTKKTTQTKMTPYGPVPVGPGAGGAGGVGGRDKDCKKEKKAKDKCACNPKLENLECRLAQLEKKGKKKRKKKRDRKGEESEKCRKKRLKAAQQREANLATYYCTCLPFEESSSSTSEKQEDEEEEEEEEQEKKRKWKSSKKKQIENNYSTDLSKNSLKNLLRRRSKKGIKLKERISSLHSSFMKHLHKMKKTPGLKNEAFIDDISKSSPMPTMRAVHVMKEEPRGLKKLERKIKKKMKEKKAERSKSKPKRRRHP